MDIACYHMVVHIADVLTDFQGTVTFVKISMNASGELTIVTARRRVLTPLVPLPVNVTKGLKATEFYVKIMMNVKLTDITVTRDLELVSTRTEVLGVLVKNPVLKATGSSVET